jgi:CelD/BcsL family acetyltransferase involved in cellulose biosynthesis
MNFAPRTPFTVEAPVFAIAVEPAFDFAGADYRSLQQRSCATAFQAPGWLDALHRDVAPAFGAEQVTVTVREQADGRLVLVLPLVRRRRLGVTHLELADFGLSDYVAPVYDPADAPLLLADATLPQRLNAALPRHDLLAITKLTADPLLERFFPRARRAHMRLSAYPAPLGADWAAWRAAKVGNSFRRDLDMKRRRLGRAGPADFALLRDADAIAKAFDALRRYRSERFKVLGAPDVLDHEAVFAFYRRMAIEGARDGSARTHVLSLSGEPIAVMFGLAQRSVYSMLLLAFDARHGRLSPGLLAVEDSIRDAIEAGDSIYDFTIGDHPYKTQFGGEPVALHEWHQARTLRGHAAMLAIAAVREAKRVLKPWLKPDKPAAKRSGDAPSA